MFLGTHAPKLDEKGRLIPRRSSVRNLRAEWF